MLNTPILRFMRKRGLFKKRCLADTAHNATYYVVLACIMLFMLLMAMCSFCEISHAQGYLDAIVVNSIEGYTPSQWCEAIRKAENSTAHPYGIMVKYEHTTPRQACINTVRNNWQKWTKGTSRYMTMQHAEYKTFLNYLGSRYCPVGVDNDPSGLNINWVKNVKYFLERG